MIEINLEGKVADAGPVKFLAAEVQEHYSPFVIVRYALSGEEQPDVLRMDLDKGVFVGLTASSTHRAAQKAASRVAEAVGRLAPWGQE